jgi:cytochrome c2
MRRLILAAAPLLLAMTHCDENPGKSSVAGGNPQRGAVLIAGLGCGSCHDIPGVRGADGRVGPPLGNIGERTIIAGMLPNTPDNMVTWLRTPQSVVPGNAMPNMEIDKHDARDVAAYLYTLR